MFVANIGPVQAPKQPPHYYSVKKKTQTFSKREQASSSMSECPAPAQPATRVYPTPCHAGHPWGVRVGYGDNKTRLLTTICSKTPCFNSVVSTSVQSENAHVLRSELIILLEKGAIERVPPTQSESGFYSRYFLIPKKDGALRPILDLRHLNCALMMRSIQADHIKTYLLADSARGLVLFSGPERCIF